MQITDRQKEIIKACGRILTEKGPTSLTVKNLAMEMGFAESALYRHFSSKEDIVLLLIKYLHHNMEERLMPIMQSNLSDEQKLRQIFKSQFTFVSEHKYFVVTVLSEGIPDDSPKIKSALLEIFTFKFGITEALVLNMLKGKNNESSADHESFVFFLLGGFRVLLLQWKFCNFSFDVNEKGEKLVNNFIELMSLSIKK
jgi:TetR/AcrR family fatty acid metabolism transcriptional regulator